jgi:hypothetical protein
MPSPRLKNQTITMLDGSKVRGKNIRLCSDFLFSVLEGVNPTSTVGLVRHGGLELPVKRTRGRSRWLVAGHGLPYTDSYAD